MTAFSFAFEFVTLLVLLALCSLHFLMRAFAGCARNALTKPQLLLPVIWRREGVRHQPRQLREREIWL